MTYSELQKLSVDALNNEQGDLIDYDCPKCKNKGDIYYLNDNGDICSYPCECRKMRYMIACARNCGLGDTLSVCKLSKFKQTYKWQKDIYNKAIKFIADDKAHLFYIGGQVGCGKSFICTAITREFIKKNYDAQFIVWADAITRLKQNSINDKMAYEQEFERLKNVQVLYIDDFFKKSPNEMDLDKAFQLINFRYNVSRSNGEKRLITIISSEKTLQAIIGIDEAIGSRILELAKPDYYITIEPDSAKNMRII